MSKEAAPERTLAAAAAAAAGVLRRADGAARLALVDLPALLLAHARGGTIDRMSPSEIKRAPLDPDAAGEPLLHVVARRGNEEWARALFDAASEHAPAALRKRDEAGLTPLHVAVANLQHIVPCDWPYQKVLLARVEGPEGASVWHLLDDGAAALRARQQGEAAASSLSPPVLATAPRGGGSGGGGGCKAKKPKKGAAEQDGPASASPTAFAYFLPDGADAVHFTASTAGAGTTSATPMSARRRRSTASTSLTTPE